MTQSPTTKMETRTIRVGPGAAMHIINSQAGSLEKAILEYIMNSEDAGATRCDISLNGEYVEIVDDGRGFDCREAIEEMFEVLCFEHPEDDWRRHGRFGMGRAQLFGYARTQWRTGEFRMDVDVQNRGMDYDLESGLEHAKGCLVRGVFYEGLTSGEIVRISRSLEEMARYSEIEVTLNGDRISVDPATEKWDHVTDDAYIRLRPSGGMAVYNLGCFVREYPGYHFGQGGTIVARKQLDVNFARNDVMVSKCPVWKRIAPYINAVVADTTRKKTTLNDDERQRLLSSWLDGDLDWSEIRCQRVIKAVTGRCATPDQFLRQSRQLGGFTLCSDDGKVAGDSAHRKKVSWVLHPEMYRWLGLIGDGEMHEHKERRVFERLVSLLPKHWSSTVSLITMRHLLDSVDTAHELLDEKDLSKRDKAILGALRAITGPMASTACELFGLPGQRWQHERRVMLGCSDAALGWTDGASFIAIELRHAREVLRGLDGIGEVVHTMIHEQCHFEPTTNEHGHDQDFFERFHDLSVHQGRFVQLLATRLMNRLKQAGFKINAKLLRVADLHQEAVARGGGGSGAADGVVSSLSQPHGSHRHPLTVAARVPPLAQLELL